MPTALGTIASSYKASAGPIPLTGLAGLWEADDASTFSYSSGTVSSQWRDKSGNNRHFDQANVAKQPDRNETINGVTALWCAGDHFFTVPAFASSFTAGEIFLVGRLFGEGGAGAGGPFGGWGTDTGSPNAHYPYLDGNIYETWGTNARKTCGNPVPNLATPHIYNLRTAAGSFVAEINGVALYSTVSNTVGFKAAGVYYLPQDASFGGATIGITLGAVIFYSRVLAGAERTQVMTYLRTKWGTP